ncbi:2443_t:CDS:2 [Acaulospora colombiana]|uniref:2443_t:CDS:1 n=1 Tax=Acaulospora colombiana TaxID=27376 RepID=A0ACA9KPH1_9GLOM|nr:2443_t:CDS:2 [Acaulospora colombiana]
MLQITISNLPIRLSRQLGSEETQRGITQCHYLSTNSSTNSSRRGESARETRIRVSGVVPTIGALHQAHLDLDGPPGGSVANDLVPPISCQRSGHLPRRLDSKMEELQEALEWLSPNSDPSIARKPSKSSRGKEEAGLVSSAASPSSSPNYPTRRDSFLVSSQHTPISAGNILLPLLLRYLTLDSLLSHPTPLDLYIRATYRDPRTGFALFHSECLPDGNGQANSGAGTLKEPTRKKGSVEMSIRYVMHGKTAELGRWVRNRRKLHGQPIKFQDGNDLMISGSQVMVLKGAAGALLLCNSSLAIILSGRDMMRSV